MKMMPSQGRAHTSKESKLRNVFVRFDVVGENLRHDGGWKRREHGCDEFFWFKDDRFRIDKSERSCFVVIDVQFLMKHD